MQDKNVILSITGTQRDESGTPDSIELVTDGKYSFEDGVARLSYMESSLTGLDGTMTSFYVRPTEVVLTREGSVNSQMVFQPGRKHYFLYDTPYGSATMGVDTHSILSTLGEHGGDLDIDYVVDFEHTIVGRNQFKINVREQKGAVL